MSHGNIALLDSWLRNTWYGMEQFGLSKALNTSARQPRGRKPLALVPIDDSSSPRNDMARRREPYQLHQSQFSYMFLTGKKNGIQ